MNSTNRWHTCSWHCSFSGNSSQIARKLKILISTRIILVLVVVFSVQISTWKSVEKMAAFGGILVLAVYSFLLKFYLKKCWKIRVCSFWSNLGFGVAFFSQKEFQSGDGEQHKQMAYLFLALLFSWKSSLRISTRRILVVVVLFSFQILLEKFYLAVYFFCSNSTWKSVEKMAAFGRILVLAVYYFLFKFYLNWKIRYCSFW